MRRFDLIVIGSGPAGEKAAVKAAYFGHSVALVEEKRKLGGAGINTGTVPSKTLKETALYFSGKRETGLYGLERVLEQKPAASHFLYRQAHVCAELESEVRDNLALHGVEVFCGQARLVSRNEIRVCGLKEELLYGDYIIIASGSRPHHPENIPFDFKRVHDSDSILTLERFPASLCIIGAGVIGCEYATIFGAMGIDVFLINDKANILPFLDSEVSGELVKIMGQNSVDILTTELRSVSVPADSREPIKIDLASEQVLNVDMVLFAAGRVGNISDLGCEKLGIVTGKRETIKVNAHYQSSVPNIYAVGDVIGFPALASTGMDQGRVAVSHIFSTDDFDRLPKKFPYGIYTIPEVSMVGVTEQEAREKDIKYCSGIAHYSKVHRGRIGGSKDGFLKLVFERNSLEVLGVHIIGPLATEIIHYGLTLVEEKKTLLQIVAVVFNYPTLHDLYKYACYDGLGNVAGHKVKEG